MTKASDNLYPKVLMDLNTSDQSAPANASWKLYAKANGIYARSSNSIIGPFGAGAGSLAAAHGARVYHNTTQTATSGAITPLVFNSERYDTDAYHDTGSNTGRLTVPGGLGGLYHIGGTFEWAGTNTTGERAIFIRLNGTTDISTGRFAPVNQTLGHHCSCDYSLGVGDYVELIAYQTSTGTRTIDSTANRSPEFWMHFIGTV